MLRCVICGNGAEEHHILTQKAYPELKDKRFNKIPLCRGHHSEWHNSAMNDMASHYFAVKVWLLNNKWSYCETKKKYVPESYT